MTIRKFKYTAEDVECRYCTEFFKGRCRAQKCLCLTERIEAGVIGYEQAVEETFLECAPLRLRIKFILRFRPKSFWKEESHAQRFERLQAIFGYYRSRNTNAYYAALYLVSSDKGLTVKMMDCFSKRRICFDHAKLQGLSPEQYALYKIAKSIYNGSAEISMEELADPELVDTAVFHLAVNAALICRYGLSALYLKSGGEEHGCLPS